MTRHKTTCIGMWDTLRRLKAGVRRTVLPIAAVLLLACASRSELAAQPMSDEPAAIEAGIAPPPGPYAPGFDALHYDIEIELPDTGAAIRGRTLGRFLVGAPRPDTLSLDLSGLFVDLVETEGTEPAYRYDGGKLHVPVPAAVRAGDTLEVEVEYAGRPDDGLILGRNLHGSPSAFADNWPNRARFWFPSIDHPSDKATVRFTVHLDPQTGRRVIANGAPEESDDPSVWRWNVTRPIPTYTMVIGSAAFVVETVGTSCREQTCTEVTTWLFPEDAAAGTASFRRAADMVTFYSYLIAPFPYSKLAHVQSSTRFGGMENVGAIFYSEQAIHEGENIELTVAHETVHQWFGNAVTESDWHHLWLSEGVATYFAALFFEHADGRDTFRAVMDGYRQRYMESEDWGEPIVHPEERNLFELLNANNYQKAAWVLHMLRVRLGDADFFEGMRSYYRTHQHDTALTDDLRGSLEAASGMPLERFFRHWIHSPGHPRLEVAWGFADGAAGVEVRQVQPSSWPTFEVPLELSFETAEGTVRRTVTAGTREASFQVELPAAPTSLTVDPDGSVLAELISLEELPGR